MHTKEQLAEKRNGLIQQLNQAAQNVKSAEGEFNQVRGAIVALDALIAEMPEKPAKKGKK